MALWVIAHGKHLLDHAKRFLEEMGVQVEREFMTEFTTQGARRERVWAEMVVEAESLDDRPSVLIADDYILDSHGPSIFLDECRRQHIKVCLLDHLRELWSDEMREILGRLNGEGYPAGEKALSWWMKRHNLAAPYVYKAGLSAFRHFLSQARNRKRPDTCEDKGKRLGRTVFGEKPQERFVVERILALHQQRQNLTQIANTINGEGHRTLTGKQFRPQTVKNYIQRYGKNS